MCAFTDTAASCQVVYIISCIINIMPYRRVRVKEEIAEQCIFDDTLVYQNTLSAQVSGCLGIRVSRLVGYTPSSKHTIKQTQLHEKPVSRALTQM